VEHDKQFGADDTELLDASAASERVKADGVLAAAFTPHCAAIQPARLARGLARVVEQQGVKIYERTPVVSITPGRVQAAAGTVRADVIIRATEGYTTTLAGEKRSLAPVWSLLVATEPLPPQVWSQLGWRDRETVADERHVIIYAQRTADDRIAFGGRGAPYLFASGTEAVRGHARAHALLEQALREMFPAARDAAVTHRWSGVLGVPRDWMPSVGFDRATGLAWAGGYVGDGVGCAALAGETLADLVLGRATDLTTLPWVGHRSPAWEPEPLRWAGIRGVSAALALADRRESRSGRPSRVASAVQRLLGD
jgi:glycine/D-amino acid oxidase-like deaminating enzyme